MSDLVFLYVVKSQQDKRPYGYTLAQLVKTCTREEAELLRERSMKLGGLPEVFSPLAADCAKLHIPVESCLVIKEA